MGNLKPLTLLTTSCCICITLIVTLCFYHPSFELKNPNFQMFAKWTFNPTGNVHLDIHQYDSSLLASYVPVTLSDCMKQGQKRNLQDAVNMNAAEILGNSSLVNTFDDLYRVKLKNRPILHQTRENCTIATFSNSSLPLTALASVPGSGNTWTRHLIQLITGW